MTICGVVAAHPLLTYDPVCCGAVLGPACAPPLETEMSEVPEGGIWSSLNGLNWPNHL